NAWARALGRNEATNGTAAATAPTPPVTTVATVKKCRLVKPVLSAIEHSLTDRAKHQVASLSNQFEYFFQFCRGQNFAGMSHVVPVCAAPMVLPKRRIIHSGQRA